MINFFKNLFRKWFWPEKSFTATTAKAEKKIVPLEKQAREADGDLRQALTNKHQLSTRIQALQTTINNAESKLSDSSIKEQERKKLADVVDSASDEIIELEKQLGELQQEELLARSKQTVALLQTKKMVRQLSRDLNQMGNYKSKVSEQQGEIDGALVEVDRLESIMEARHQTDPHSPSAQATSRVVVSCYRQAISSPIQISRQASESTLEVDEAIKKTTRIAALKTVENLLETLNRNVTEDREHSKVTKELLEKSTEITKGYHRLGELNLHEAQVVLCLDNIGKYAREYIEKEKQSSVSISSEKKQSVSLVDQFISLEKKQTIVSVVDKFLKRLGELIAHLEEDAVHLPTVSAITGSPMSHQAKTSPAQQSQQQEDHLMVSH